jgi:hypothetical protein
MQADYADTKRDIACLNAVVCNLDIFIKQNGGEDRSALRMDLFRYRALLEQARSLAVKIAAKMASEYGAQPPC